MTPDEAQHAIRDAEYIGANLPGECWRALDTIAGMHPEYRAEYYEAALDKWVLVTGWTTEYDARYALRPGIFRAAETRIRIRYVTTPEEA